MEEDIKELLEIVVKRYIEEYIINLNLSDSTKNLLKRELRKTFLDEDLFYDLKTIAYKNSIPKSKIKEKIEELEKYIYKGENAPQDFLQYRIKAKIQVLQELLEEE